MFKDYTKQHKFTKIISVRENEDTVTELMHWVKDNINNGNVNDFTCGRFSDVSQLILALSNVYKELGVEGIKGKTSDYLLLIAGSGKDKIYLSHVRTLNKSKYRIFNDNLGMDIQRINSNLSKLTWRKNGGI